MRSKPLAPDDTPAAQAKRRWQRRRRLSAIDAHAVGEEFARRHPRWPAPLGAVLVVWARDGGPVPVTRAHLDELAATFRLRLAGHEHERRRRTTGEPATPAEFVLVAASGRLRLASGESVPPEELAALAGIERGWTHAVAEQGDHGWRVPAWRARRNPREHGVAGF